jgi:hypothetical protein
MTAAAAQSVSTSLASLPDADVLIYVSPQMILNDAAPRVMPPKDVTSMRDSFAEMKKAVGIDPSAVEYMVIALRFHKPAGDLSFVAPDVMAVMGGDFSSDSLISLAQLALQDKVRLEKHGSKTIALMRIDALAEEAVKNPMLKSLVDVGAVPLSANSIAIGNLPYLKSAIDAADGTGRINPATIESLLRDPNALLAGAGAPLASFAKAFGMFGTETTPRESSCNTPFGNFYTAITLSGTNFSVRGAMNADNPDTAKIISSLFSGLMQQAMKAETSKPAATVLDSVKMTPEENQMFLTVMKSVKVMPRDNEVVWEADIPQAVVADIFKPKPPAATKTDVKSTTPKKRRPVRRKRTR